MTDYQAQVEAFLARGGTVTRAAEGEGLGLSPRDWYNKVSDGPAVVTYSADQTAERKNEIFGAARLNGASVSEALDATREG